VLNRADLAELWDGDCVIAAGQRGLESGTPEGVLTGVLTVNIQAKPRGAFLAGQHDRLEDREPPAIWGAAVALAQ
jgi:hypothetical protein